MGADIKSGHRCTAWRKAMRKKKVWRYWCDFCNKGGCGCFQMKIHEKHCTMNPNRQCRICPYIDLGKTQPINVLIVALGNGDTLGMSNLRRLCGNCPACILSAIRQSGIENKRQIDSILESDNFIFQEELKSFWAGRDTHVELPY